MKNPRTIIIAEAGVNHNGDLRTALQLVDAAADVGADIVKFQSFTADQLVVPGASKAAYQKVRTDSLESQFEMLRKLELNTVDHQAIYERCQARKIEFLSTGFDTDTVDMLVDLGIQCIKIPSGEISNLPYLRHVGRLGLPVILSSGMSDLAEVARALEVLYASGTQKHDVTVLHCTSEYPAPIFDVNLRAMLTMSDTFKVKVGYSDHTQGIEVAISAVALGACVIEKHLTLSNSSAGPDHKASLEPDQFANMVKAIRNIESALGDGVKAPRPSEMANIPVARKSIVAATAIFSGEEFSEQNITVKRPGTGLSPMFWDEILGQKAMRNYMPDEMIDL